MGLLGGAGRRCSVAGWQWKSGGGWWQLLVVEGRFLSGSGNRSCMNADSLSSLLPTLRRTSGPGCVGRGVACVAKSGFVLPMLARSRVETSLRAQV